MSVSSEIRHKGKTYSVHRLDRDRKNAFSTLAKASALAAVVALRSLVPEDEYKIAYKAAVEHIGSGAFAFHSDFTQKALQEHGGVLMLTQVLLDCSEDEVVELFRERRDEVRAALDLALKESDKTDPPKAE